jgi:hypothetical protein
VSNEAEEQERLELEARLLTLLQQGELVGEEEPSGASIVAKPAVQLLPDSRAVALCHAALAASKAGAGSTCVGSLVRALASSRDSQRPWGVN